MTDITLKLIEAFNRHSRLNNALLNMETLTAAHIDEVTINLSAGHVRALTQILNMAPLDGDPLNLPVNIEADTDLLEREEERTSLYLHDNGMEPTLENVAAAFLYSGADTPYINITLPYGKYCIARISGIKQEANTTGAATFALTTITTPGGWNEKVNTTFDFPNADISYVEGEEYKNLGARVLRYYEPGKNAALGGILMERTA